MSLEYEDDKNSMIAITEKDTDNSYLYEDFYDEFDNRIYTGQSMNMIFFGPHTSFMRLDAETILHVLANTKKHLIPITRTILAWDMITAFDTLLNEVPEEDLYYVNFGDPSVLSFFATHDVGVLVAAYRRYFGTDWYSNKTCINQMGYLLCGFASTDLMKISPNTFKQLNVDVLGRLDRCDINQTKHYSSSDVNQYELSSRLLSLTENNKSYTLTQINGQRIYRKAPHAWSGPEPSRSCEVFIGRIPHDCFEDTLVPMFRQAGELFEFRLMINFSGWNRGYAFAMYTTELEAANAIRLFNNYMIRPSWQLGVCQSINNCRIFISRIPPTTPSAEIVRLLYALTDEVQERGVELNRAPDEPSGASPPPAAPSYTLEPWSQARRLRMIQEAQRNAAA
ncbi:RNA-binding protein 47, partial [Operophtera brumata]